jgi:hypothetical protein
MARKAETTFIASVHRHLAVGVYREKMNNPYRSGTADVWYSGQKDLWVEYKFLPQLPKRMDTFIKLDLSENQKIWLRERHAEGRHVAVICGCKAGGVVFNGLSWDQPISNPEFTSRVITRPELAAWLLAQTGEVNHGTTENPHRDRVIR